MGTELANLQPKSLLSADEIETLRNSKFKGFTPGEIKYCVAVVNQLNLSPFLNQVHFVKRVLKDGSAVISTQVGIDGFRLHAQRAGGYAGSDEPIYEYNQAKEIIKATVTVYKIVSGVRCPFTASARWDEYYPGQGPNSRMWDKMPHNQLAKCAEALALRKAFPAELSSLYAEEEMHKDREQKPWLEQPKAGDGVIPLGRAAVIDSGTSAKKHVGELSLAELRTKKRILEEKDSLSIDEQQTLDQVNGMIETLENMEPETVEPEIDHTLCICGIKLTYSKNKGVYYCPNFKVAGEHVRPIAKADYEARTA